MKGWIAGGTLVLTIAPGIMAQQASRVTTAADRDLITALVAREDSRGPFGSNDPRNRGLASANPYIRAFTVRGLGRLESPSIADTIARMSGDPSAEVRAAAAEAMAQSVARTAAAPAEQPNDARAGMAGAVARVRSRLGDLLATERDATVRAAALESFGRLVQGSPDQVMATANAIAPSLSASSVVERRGAIRGIFFLARKREARTRGAIPTAVTQKMFDMLTDPSSADLSPTDRFNISYALVSASALTDSQSVAMLSHRETFVRERAMVNLGRSTDTSLLRSVLPKAMADREPVVRFRGLNVYAQKLRATGCDPLVAMTRDVDTTVALGAVDALSGCRGDVAVSSHLATLAGQLADDDRWHLPAHAFVSLSVVDPARAKSLLPRFVTAKNFFVRMYADTAARLMRDVATLYDLSRDEHPNVQASAIEGLSRLVGHAADSVYMRALDSDDNQVLMAAAAGLKNLIPGGGGTASAPRENVLMKALARLTNRRARAWDTDADGNNALRELVIALGGRIYNGGPTAPTPKPLPTFEDLAALERSTARIEMMDGSVVTLRFHPFDAPTNAFRFARLARAGTFDGLTFHRVAPFFVVQGPGPNANEYSAPDKGFARDELGVSNVRGTVGLSTRGRDTADGQIYINTVDNVWLDHEYTVMATVTSGLEAFDRMQEGARIRRVTIQP